MKRILIVIFCLLALLCTEVNAQKSNSVAIYNSSANPVTFSLSSDAKNWQDYSLAGAKLQQYDLNSNQTCWFKVETKSNGPMSVAGKAQYQLDTRKKYQIYWNINKLQWDLIEYK